VSVRRGKIDGPDSVIASGAQMTRTIVVSDIHGFRNLLEAALEHAGFSAGDRLIVAGDLIDVGHDDIIGLTRELGGTILAGNHEVAAALGLTLAPQNPESRARGAEFAEALASGEWPLTANADGWIVTHAGLSAALDDFLRPLASDPDAIVRELNERFIAEMTVAREQDSHDWPSMERFRILGGQLGPLWFRPIATSDLLGVRQIAGHTPVGHYTPAAVNSLAAAGLLLVDAGGHLRNEPGRFRYALIEDGAARVVDSDEL
jgi:hypothetical protein